MWRKNAENVVVLLETKDPYLMKQIQTHIGRFDRDQASIENGPYYIEERMNRLRSQTRDRAPRSFAVPIQEVPGILKTYYSNEA